MQWLGEGEYTYTHPEKPLTTTFIPHDWWDSAHFSWSLIHVEYKTSYAQNTILAAFCSFIFYFFYLRSDHCTHAVLRGHIVMYVNIKINSKW